MARKQILVAPGDPASISAMMPALEILAGDSAGLHVSVFLEDYKLNQVVFDRLQKLPAELYLLEPADKRFWWPSGKQVDVLLTGSRIPKRTPESPDHEPRLEQLLIAEAKKRTVPSVHLQPLWTDMQHTLRDPTYKGSEPAVQFSPDVLCVIDDAAAKRATDMGYKGRIEVTGNPSFDGLSGKRENYETRGKDNVRRELGFPLDRKVIFFANQPIRLDRGNEFGYTEESVLRNIAWIAQQDNSPFKDARFMIRHHPRNSGERGNAYVLEAMLELAGLNFGVDTSKDMNAAFFASDVVIGMESSVLFNAAAMGVPVISYQPGVKKGYEFGLNEAGVTVPIYKSGVEGQRELRDLLTGLCDKLNNSANLSYDWAPNHSLYFKGKKAAPKVASVIENLL